MKVFALLICSFVATSVAQQRIAQRAPLQQNAPAQQADEKRPNVPILAQESNLQHDGTFNYLFESGDGTRAEQSGQLKYVDQQNAGEAVSGQYSYQGDDGQTYSVSYTADENGYRPVGAHLPTPPPVPEAIARAVEYLRSLPPQKDQQ